MTEPTHCPRCGRALGSPSALVQEFWARDERWFVCRCPRCRRADDICAITRPRIVERVEG